MGAVDRSGDGFVAFFRRYATSWVHAVAAAGLTAFGTLTFVNRWFAVVALAAYVVPPVALYLSHGDDAVAVLEGEPVEAGTGGPAETDAGGPAETDAGGQAETDAGGPAETDAAESAEADPKEPTASGRGSGGRRDASADHRDGLGGSTPAADDGRTWEVADVPTDEDLHGVAITAEGACAVGDGGIVLSGDVDEWTVELADGPAAEGNDLTGVDATADGTAVWVAGDSGALARIDAETWRHTDFTAPEEITDNWTGVAVGGPAGDETVLLVNGSGQVLRGEFGDDGPSWTSPIEPGGGSSISGVDLVGASLGYCCDTNDGVFETADGGDSFERIGVDGAGGTLTDVAGVDPDDALVTADDGVVHRYDGRAWTPDRLDDDALAGVARWEGRAVACGEDAVFERPAPTDDWARRSFEDSAFDGVAVRGERAIAVGEDGAIVARDGIAPPTSG